MVSDIGWGRSILMDPDVRYILTSPGVVLLSGILLYRFAYHRESSGVTEDVPWCHLSSSTSLNLVGGLGAIESLPSRHSLHLSVPLSIDRRKTFCLIATIKKQVCNKAGWLELTSSLVKICHRKIFFRFIFNKGRSGE